MTVVDLQADVRGIAAKQFSCNIEYTDGTAIGQSVCVLLFYLLFFIVGGGEDYDEGGQTSISLYFQQEQTLQLSLESLFILMTLMNLLKNLHQLLKTLMTLLDFFRQDTIIEIIVSDGNQ